MIRIEPEFASAGKRLFVGVNGAQNIAQGAPISPMLQHVDVFRCYVKGIHERLQ